MIDRYTLPGMGGLFTEKHKFDTWLKVELAVCECWAKEGKIPKDAYNRIKRKARFKLKRIEEIEAEVHHDVIAFTTAVKDYIGDDSAYFHKGLTSSDVVDTAQNVVLKQAGQLLEQALGKFKQAVGERALEHKHTPAMGRTHGVHAEPTTLGLKLLIWYDELSRHEERLAAAIDQIAVGKLSGAVGNFAHIPPAFEEKVLKSLGLQPAPVSNQVVQRDRHAQFVTTIAGIGATLEKMAVNLRTWQRTELGEAQEPFAKGQKGSSAMPHKKNPILLERITGLARVLRGYAVTSLENVALWDERDISHSGAERVILADACILLDYMMAKFTDVMSRLEIRKRRLERNIYFTKGLIFSQRVLLALTGAGLSREDAYRLVQTNAMRCWEDETPLLDALLNDREVRAVLDAPDITALFSLEPYMAHVDRLFDRVGLKSGQAKPPEKTQPPAKQPGKQRRTRVKKPVEPKREVSAGPVQNIAERPADYYESVNKPKDNSSEADETLGEARHQKKKRRVEKPAAKADRSDRAGRAGDPPKTEPKKDEEEKPKRKRRAPRKKKPVADVKPSESNDDDSYVD